MPTTIVGLFDDFAHAQQAAQELESIGINRGDVAITRGEAGSNYAVYGGQGAGGYSEPKATGGISGFFDSLFGTDVDERDRDIYAEAARRGSAVLTVKAPEEAIERVTAVLNRFHAVDIDKRASHYAAAGYAGYDANAPVYTAEQTREELERFGAAREVSLPVIEEQLKVGKREVQRGGVRVHSRVTERPVEEQVQLREEHVTVARRPADRAVSAAELNTLRDAEVVVTESAEEAVTSKEARVVEEVVVGKRTEQRTETVRDTVRKTDVDVEHIGAGSGKKTRG